MKIDLVTATAKDFDTYIGESFTVQTEHGSIVLLLDNVKRLNASNTRENVLELDGVTYPPREPFSLTFVGPLEPTLPQMTYCLDNKETGQLNIFLSPSLKESTAIIYDCTFS